MLSKEEVEERLNQIIEQKRLAREKRQEELLNDPNDPWNQFQARFVDKLPEYKKDKKNNEMYYLWFQAWKNGEVIDSDLRWAPTVMNYDDTMRDNFIQYMKIQYSLHKKAGFVKRALFLNTIYKYYPELSTSMRGLENDLANYEEENNIINTKRILEEEIRKFGLPLTSANYLAGKKINTEKLREEAQLIKRNIEKGYSEDACIFILIHNFPEERLPFITKVMKNRWPEELIEAYLKNKIDDEAASNIIDKLNDVIELFGVDAMGEILPWTGKTYYEDWVDSEINKWKRKQVGAKLNKKVF